MSTEVWFGNVSFTINGQQLKEIFGKAGRIKNFYMPFNEKIKRHNGWGIVTYYSGADAEKAINNHGMRVGGRPLKVNYNTKSSTSPSRPPSANPANSVKIRNKNKSNSNRNGSNNDRQTPTGSNIEWCSVVDSINVLDKVTTKSKSECGQKEQSNGNSPGDSSLYDDATFLKESPKTRAMNRLRSDWASDSPDFEAVQPLEPLRPANPTPENDYISPDHFDLTETCQNIDDNRTEQSEPEILGSPSPMAMEVSTFLEVMLTKARTKRDEAIQAANKEYEETIQKLKEQIELQFNLMTSM